MEIRLILLVSNLLLCYGVAGSGICTDSHADNELEAAVVCTQKFKIIVRIVSKNIPPLNVKATICIPQSENDYCRSDTSIWNDVTCRHKNSVKHADVACHLNKKIQRVTDMMDWAHRTMVVRVIQNAGGSGTMTDGTRATMNDIGTTCQELFVTPLMRCERLGDYLMTRMINELAMKEMDKEIRRVQSNGNVP